MKEKTVISEIAPISEGIQFQIEGGIEVAKNGYIIGGAK